MLRIDKSARYGEASVAWAERRGGGGVGAVRRVADGRLKEAGGMISICRADFGRIPSFARNTRLRRFPLLPLADPGWAKGK